LIAQKDFCRETFEVEVASTFIRGEVFMPRERDMQAPTLVLCHGIPAGETRPDRRKNGYIFWGRFLARRGYPVVIFNFRGTGESGGNLNLKEWVWDLQGVLNIYNSAIDPQCPGVVLIGFSAGAAVSVKVAAEDSRVKAAVLAACPADFNFFFETFTLEGVMEWMNNAGFFREPGYPPHSWKWQKEFLSVHPETQVAHISPRPLLLLHGEQDDLVPLEHARKLYQKARHPKKLITFYRLGHRLRSYPRVFSTILNWLDQCSW